VSGFVHLHCHSTWSLLDGAIPAEMLPHLAAALGYDAIALTDHDSLTGAVRFSQACRDAGVKPIFGAELTLAPRSGRTGKGRGRAVEHVTVLAQNARGYANLCRLITGAHLTNARGAPETTFEAVAERGDGLFVLSGCRNGEVARLAARGRIPDAVEAARKWHGAFGDAYRIEIFDQRGYGDRTLRDRLLRIAGDAGVTPVATNDVHYARRADAATHELLHSIKHIVPLSRTQALRPNAEYRLKGPDVMRELFSDVPAAYDETVRIADACDFDLDLGSYHFPDEAVGGGRAQALLARRCFEGAARRFGTIRTDIEDRLQHELRMIHKLGWPSYFLLVADIIDHVRGVLGIRCTCRGSAAGSLVCYVLGISDVDPVRYELLFERFMNTRREELPDIDVDVESHRREEVLDYILQTYGPNQTAICCMVDTFRARMAIRDVGKALGLPGDEIDIVAKAFPRIAARDIPAAIERLPELARTNLGAGQLERLFSLCRAIDGFPRHLALHPSGVILSSPDLGDRVPMQESFGGFTMLQADKDDVEQLGLVKLDVLGVRMLSAISHAVEEIERTTGDALDLDTIPKDDPATYDLIRSSRTLGCFQIESPGQRELLARLQPERFEDLIVDISLFRPGPVQSDMVGPYLERRHGFAEVVYPDESLAPVLRETNGIIVFHEQVIRVIALATGCSLDDADYVRRHLDSERPALPGDPTSRPRTSLDGPRNQIDGDNAVGRWFQQQACANGYAPAVARALWNEVFAFASFGFCKSHAAAFALPTYLSSWLKAHHPAAFVAGLLTHDPGMYPRRLMVADSRTFGIDIRPVDVNASASVYRVEDRGRAVRVALSAVHGITAAEMTAIVAARREARFGSLEDFWRRCDVSRPTLENLVHVGAFDEVAGGRSRRELLWTATSIAAEARSRIGAQLSFHLDTPIAEHLPGLPDLSAREETEAELEVTGIDARRHVMELYGSLVAELRCTAGADLGRVRTDREVWVAGVKVASQTPAIRSGQRIIFITLDDLTGPIDLTLFERAQPRCAATVFHSWLLVVKGVVRKRGGASLTHETHPTAVGVTVVVDEAFDLAELARDRSDGLPLPRALARQRRRAARGAGGLGASSESPSKLWHSSGGSAGR
jgi:error-prone DNA polymerase